MYMYLYMYLNLNLYLYMYLHLYLYLRYLHLYLYLRYQSQLWFLVCWEREGASTITTDHTTSTPCITSLNLQLIATRI